ncbi:hypothetical protein CMV_017799 [Castanea mollissima]|uniref:Uncharacterized protein n=1 Tax=Castanea mollissima TaxID=60419 RepID=A0A8J4R2B5_9ROSI|nr:hypothetical protein CMV_017799 [Castanea mollissima]
MLFWAPSSKFVSGGWEPKQEKNEIHVIDDARTADRLINWINKQTVSSFGLDDEKFENQHLSSNVSDPLQIAQAFYDVRRHMCLLEYMYLRVHSVEVHKNLCLLKAFNFQEVTKRCVLLKCTESCAYSKPSISRELRDPNLFSFEDDLPFLVQGVTKGYVLLKCTESCAYSVFNSQVRETTERDGTSTLHP